MTNGPRARGRLRRSPQLPTCSPRTTEAAGTAYPPAQRAAGATAPAPRASPGLPPAPLTPKPPRKFQTHSQLVPPPAQPSPEPVRRGSAPRAMPRGLSPAQAPRDRRPALCGERAAALGPQPGRFPAAPAQQTGRRRHAHAPPHAHPHTRTLTRAPSTRAPPHAHPRSHTHCTRTRSSLSPRAHPPRHTHTLQARETRK